MISCPKKSRWNVFFCPPELSFLQKIKKLLNLENLENYLKKDYLSERNAFNLQRSIFAKVVDWKIYWCLPVVLYTFLLFWQPNLFVILEKFILILKQRLLVIYGDISKMSWIENGLVITIFMKVAFNVMKSRVIGTTGKPVVFATCKNVPKKSFVIFCWWNC